MTGHQKKGEFSLIEPRIGYQQKYNDRVNYAMVDTNGEFRIIGDNVNGRNTREQY
jgi:hypothetical protein